MTLRSGDAAWCWKIAYDETFSRASPGVQLLLDVTDDAARRREHRARRFLRHADHPMIDHVWRERLALSDRLMCVGHGSALSFTAACALEAARRAVIGSAKRLRGLLRR